jgi:tetratricopeptide (TPR) repeat protein
MTQTTDEIELYRQFMSKDPSSQAFIYLAEALWENKMYAEAIETCVNGLRLHPHDLRARVILGLSYLRTDELEFAEVELLKAKEMLEINTVTYQALAELYEKKGDVELAGSYRQLFQTILTPGIAEVENGATGFEIESLPEETEQEDGEMATVTMAELYTEQGHPEEAIEVYRRILRSNPEAVGVKVRLEELEKQVGKDKAARTLLKILESWQDELQDRASVETTLPPNKPVGIDQEKLAALVQTYVRE